MTLLKPEYIIPTVISVTVFAVVGYILYKKYKPLVDTANTTNDIIGAIEAPFIGVEEWFHRNFPDNNGDGYNGTPGMYVDQGML